MLDPVGVGIPTLLISSPKHEKKTENPCHVQNMFTKRRGNPTEQRRAHRIETRVVVDVERNGGRGV